MALSRYVFVINALAFVTSCATVHAAETIGDRLFDVVADGKPAAMIVIPADDAPIWRDAVGMIRDTAARWGGAAPNVVRLGPDDPLPAGNLIILGTAATSGTIAALAGRMESLVSRVAFGDDHGFAIESRSAGDARQLIIAGKTPRGVYNGAVLCRDFLLDATSGAPGEADVFVRAAAVYRTPRLPARGTYHLSIYGPAAKYTAEDWMRIIDRYAEDGMERVYFWLSGHHTSERFPHLFNVGATEGTPLTPESVRQLIRYCHDRSIEFHIGGGVFGWVAAEYLAEGHPEIKAVGAGGLCPSQPYARTANREHLLEMLDTWPEADGFMLEIRDEYHECRCDACQVRLDEHGSKQYGRAEITWLQELAREAWQRKPAVRFCWLIGYSEHASDVLYYDEIRRMNDPRFEWLDVRVSLDKQGPWHLPGPNNEPRPLPFFSRRIMHWDPFYKLELRWLLLAARRTADEGLYGYVPAFEPGFDSGSYYYDEIPLPVNILPYCLTGFAYREVTWDPAITMEELRRRIQRRYFSPEASPQFTDDMIYLRQFSIDHARFIKPFAEPGHDGSAGPALTLEGELKRVQAIVDQKERSGEADQLLSTFGRLSGIARHLDRMAKIEAAVAEATPAASPRTREGFGLLMRMIRDTRTLYARAVLDPTALNRAIETLRSMAGN